MSTSVEPRCGVGILSISVSSGAAMRHGKNAGHLDPVVATAMRVLPQAMLLKRYALSEILHPILGYVPKVNSIEPAPYLDFNL